MNLSPERASYLRREKTSALVCLPFLDTDEPEERRFANMILAERGYPRLIVWALRRLAAVGLWYQVFLWEDLHLDLSDVLAGYGVIAGFVGLLVLLFSWVLGIALLASAAVLLFFAWVGWGRFRRRSAGERDAA